VPQTGKTGGRKAPLTSGEDVLEGTSGGEWPLVGRDEELALLRDLRSSPRRASAFISGAAGVGKTRLARTALTEASAEGWAALALKGSVGFAGVPLGPFRTVLSLPSASELTELTEAVAQELSSLRSARGMLIWVDDCQALDEATAGLVNQLVASGVLTAIMTSRSGAHPPAALTELWQGELAQRIELQNLSRRETIELLTAGLGGPVQDSSASRLWHVTAGNPLYVKEVILASRETGALQEVDGEWRWHGDWAAGARIQEVVAARLGRLDPDELTVMEMLALAGTLPLELLSGLTSIRVLEGLEGRSLVTTDRSGRRLEVTIANPLHSEVLRSGMPELRQRSVRRNLADALTASGARRAADRVRLASWSLESGDEVDVMTLSLGSQATLFGIGPAVGARIQEILPGSGPGSASSGPPVRQDIELGVRLAEAAYERSGGGVIEGVALASAYGIAGAIDRAEAVLAELMDKTSDVNDRLRMAHGLGWVRFWGRFEVDAAWLILAGAAQAAETTGGYDPTLLAEIYQSLAGIALNTGRPALALEYSARTARTQGVGLSTSLAAAPAAAALAYLGRCHEAIALVDEGSAAAHDSGDPFTVPQLLFCRAAAQLWLGEVEQARQLLDWLRDVALKGGLLDATALFDVLLGEILIHQGRFASAGRIFRDSAGLLSEKDLFGYRPWALAGLARTRTQAGEEDSAATALEEARRVQPIHRHFESSLRLADIERHAAAGRINDAIDAARDAVTWTRGHEMRVNEALILEAWLRLEPSNEIVERLAEISRETDSTFVDVLAQDARAVLGADPKALLEVGERYAAMTVWFRAAAAADMAWQLLEQRRDARAAKAAARRAAEYAAQCDGIRPLASQGQVVGARLTKREREIATLAAAGGSSKEIAERMYLSPRTVENHLYNAYAKLGVTDRAALAEVLGPSVT
jgi:DNA-binding NarL/FixJ family response regulator